VPAQRPSRRATAPAKDEPVCCNNFQDAACSGTTPFSSPFPPSSTKVQHAAGGRHQRWYRSRRHRWAIALAGRNTPGVGRPSKVYPCFAGLYCQRYRCEHPYILSSLPFCSLLMRDMFSAFCHSACTFALPSETLFRAGCAGASVYTKHTNGHFATD